VKVQTNMGESAERGTLAGHSLNGVCAHSLTTLLLLLQEKCSLVQFEDCGKGVGIKTSIKVRE
jgi:hypothetical protein